MAPVPPRPENRGGPVGGTDDRGEERRMRLEANPPTGQASSYWKANAINDEILLFQPYTFRSCKKLLPWMAMLSPV